MAVFWKNIKGMAEEGNDTIYTYIDFITSSNGSKVAIKRDEDFLGNIALADSALPQNINAITTQKIGAEGADSKTIDFNKNLITVNPEATFKAAITAEENAVFIKDVFINEGVKAKTASITGECQAGFFNATSDKRSKENFEPLSTEAALKAVLETPLYSFDYKGGPHCIGVLAQDLIHVDMNNFSFVGNQKASAQMAVICTSLKARFLNYLGPRFKSSRKKLKVFVRN